MASEQQVLMIASEYEGLVKTGGLADVARALPAALSGQGADVRVVLPWYRSLQTWHPEVVLPTLTVRMNLHETQGCRIRQWQDGAVTVYLVEHHDFFDRAGLYDDGEWPYADNPLRFAFLCQAALELTRQLDFQPDILHAHDWQTALAPYYLRVHRAGDAFFRDTRSILNVHNGAYQGLAGVEWLDRIGLDTRHFVPEQFEDHTDLNLLKGGLYWADRIVPVSPGYAAELLEPETSHGLWQAFRTAGPRVRGILNGCDYGLWDPAIDPHIAVPFSPDDLAGKAACKSDLQKASQLPELPDTPLFGLVSRLTDQKGFSYLLPALPDWLEQSDAQLVMLGSGDPDTAHRLRALARQFPHQVHFTLGYSDALAHRIEAGCDFFLMPSRFEPCGLNQIYSMKYGTLPLVRLTGGLRDTVIPLNDRQSNRASATGLGFEPPDVTALRRALDQATALYRQHPETYRQLQSNAMATSFTWDRAATDYLALYRELLQKHPVRTL